MRLYHQFGRLPVRGGIDDQPAQRLAWMQFAERVRAHMERQYQSKNWADDMTEDDSRLIELFVEADNA